MTNDDSTAPTTPDGSADGVPAWASTPREMPTASVVPIPEHGSDGPVVISSSTAPAVTGHRWSGKKTAVAAALALGVSTVTGVTAAAAMQLGSNAGGRFDHGGPGGGQFPGGGFGHNRGGMPGGGFPGQGGFAPGQSVPGGTQQGSVQQGGAQTSPNGIPQGTPAAANGVAPTT